VLRARNCFIKYFWGDALIEIGGFVLYTLLYKSDAVIALKVEEQKG